MPLRLFVIMGGWETSLSLTSFCLMLYSNLLFARNNSFRAIFFKSHFRIPTPKPMNQWLKLTSTAGKV